MTHFCFRLLDHQRKKDKKTALHLALEYRLQSHTEALLDFKGKWLTIAVLNKSVFIDGSIVCPDLKTIDGKTALQIAIEKGFHLDLISDILER